jgi:hypothetical protein
MNDHDAPVVPIWTLSTSEAATLVPVVTDGGTLTPERLTELRSALAAFSSTPLVTLEAHPLAKKRGRSAGLPLDTMSPLAQELSRLVAANAESVPAVAQVAESSEVLYRMVIPAKFAQMSKGLVKSMKSNAVAGGIYDNLVDAANVSVAKATLVPVETAAQGAATTGVAGNGGGGGRCRRCDHCRRPFGSVRGSSWCERLRRLPAAEGDRAHHRTPGTTP